MDFSDLGFSEDFLKKYIDADDNVNASDELTFPLIWCQLNCLLIHRLIERFKKIGDVFYNGLMNSSYMNAKAIIRTKNSCVKRMLNSETGVVETTMTMTYNVDGTTKKKLYVSGSTCTVSFKEYFINNTLFFLDTKHFLKLDENIAQSGNQKTKELIRRMISGDIDNVSSFTKNPKLARYLQAKMQLCIIPTGNLTVKVVGHDDITVELSDLYYPLYRDDKSLDKMVDMLCNMCGNAFDTNFVDKICI